MSGALVLLALLCPRCETMRASAEPDKALDIVFLPDGFTTAQLPMFRCTTDLLAAQLVTIPPFDDPERLVNIHRVDLISDAVSGEPASGCSDPMCARTDPVLPPSCTGDLGAWERARDSLPSSDPNAIPTVRLGAELCGGGTQTRCEFMSLSENSQIAAIQHASEAPAVDVVVVLVNAGKEGGVAKPGSGFSGLMTLYEGSPPVVVVTLEGIDGDGCVNRLAHEIGHAFGLLDEYNEVTFVDGAAAGPPPCGPNVTDPSAAGCVPAIPWGAACTRHDRISCETQTPIEECRVSTTPNCCQEPVPDTAPNTSSYVGALPDPSAIGLFEGAYYRDCGYYRSADICRMRVNADPFCAVCLATMVDRFPDEPECVLLSIDGSTGVVMRSQPVDPVDLRSAASTTWTDSLLRGLRSSVVKRFRALVDFGGTKAWVPVKEARVSSRIAPWDLNPDGRVEVRIDQKMQGLEPRFEVNSRGALPPPRPRRWNPPQPPLPPSGAPPVEIRRVTVHVRTLFEMWRSARAIEMCMGRVRPQR